MTRFYGQFDPPVDQFIYERYFPNKEIKGFFIECGAYDGLVDCSCKFFEENMGWKGLNLEPVPTSYKNLVVNRPSSKNLRLGLSNHSGSASFRHAISPILGTNLGNGSIRHTPQHIQSLIEHGCTFEDLEIEVVTYKELIERENIDHVDLLVLDVEGHELAVIEGMKGCHALPDLICIEIGHLDFYEVKRSLTSLGYTYDVSSYANAFFIKDEKLSLFALRYSDLLLIQSQKQSSSISSIIQENNQILKNHIAILEQDNQTLRNHVAILEEDNQILKNHLTTLVNCYKDIIRSKAWRLVECLRKGKMALKKLKPKLP